MFQKSFTRQLPVIARVVIAFLLVATATVATSTFSESSANAAARSRATKYLVCHRTNAIKNPYRLISVAWSSVDGNGNGHDNPVHDGPVFNITTPAAVHGATPRDSGLGTEAGGGNDRWGDIFNAVKTQGNSNSNNWDTAGQAIFSGAINSLTGKPACRAMSAIDYIKSEREENPNKPMATIMAELDDMEAAEDVALKQALGGSFTQWFQTCNPATTDCENTTVITQSIDTKSPRVTTEPPTSVSTGSSSNRETATLNGTVSPQEVSMVWYFEFDDDSDFTPSQSDNTDVVEVPGTPGSASGNTTSNVSYNATGLNAAKTYYYRTVGVATSGSNDSLVETYLYGVTRQFSFGAPAAPTIDSISCGNTTLSVAFTAGSANGGTITNYQYSIDGGDTFVSLATPSTSSPISITGLTNGTEYRVVVRAITSTKTGADSATVNATPCGTPSSTTTAATNVQPTTATLNGHLTGNGNDLASITFTWGTTSTSPPGNNTVNANVTTLPGTANAYPVLANITGLTGGTTYYFEVSGTYANGQSTTLGGVQSFTTPAAVVLPTTTTEPATNVQEQSATLNGTGTSNGASSTITFTWGLSPTLASGNTTTPALESPLASNATSSPVTLNISGLTGGTRYYFQVTITNSNGTATGIIRSFTTPAAVVLPAATTDPATNVQERTATLNGTGTSNGASSTITFTWGTSPTLASGNTTTPAVESPLASNASSSPVTLNVSGLTGGTTYYFQVTITNTNGTATGIIRSFTTPAATSTTAAPTTASSTFTGALSGVVWIDRNLNERKDADEPGIPFTPMVATLVTSAVGGTAGTKLTFTTDGEGKYSVPTLEPGEWSVSATLITDAIARTFDSDSTAGAQSVRSASSRIVNASNVRSAAVVDWQAKATVPVNGLGIADFAGAGDAALKVEVEIPAACVKSNSVEINWAGYDLKLGTSDDATFVVSLKDKEATVKRIPYGAYSITPICTSGVKLAAEQVVLEKSESRAIAVKAQLLPETGRRNTQPLTTTAMLLVILGVAFVSRRKRADA